MSKLIRFYNNESIYFVTYLTKNRYEFFRNELLCNLFIEELKLTKEIKKFQLFAFCIMYEHVHLLIKPEEPFTISQITKSLKENFSRDANRLINPTSHRHHVNETPTSRLQIENFLSTNIINDLPSFSWHQSFYDRIVRNTEELYNKLNYINTNHLKHNLPTDWKYIGYNFEDLIDLK